MTGQAQRSWAHCRHTITAAVDEVFCVVGAVRDEALALHRTATQQGRRLVAADVAALGDHVRQQLQQPGSLVVGLGLIVAPDVLADRHLHLEWWQAVPGRLEPQPLRVDLDPASTGFYDYASAEWFDAPRRTRLRHVEGPYVDVHGTGAYVLTLSMPIVAGGAFLGVAGADVPASWLEDRLPDGLDGAGDVVVVNAVGRVVLSSSPDWLVGELVPPRRLRTASEEDLGGLPWRAVRLPLVESALGG